MDIEDLGFLRAAPPAARRGRDARGDQVPDLLVGDVRAFFRPLRFG